MAEQKASKDPERIEAEIEQTREDLGETVAALAEKTDVKKQAHDKVEETKEAARAKVSDTSDLAKEKFQAMPEAASQTANRTLEALRQNPAPAVVTLGALLVVAVIVRRRRR
jgi:ElaB/YqjD/DUF883 family membrane-anchored ribosome-binding protein